MTTGPPENSQEWEVNGKKPCQGCLGGGSATAGTSPMDLPLSRSTFLVSLR